MEVTVHIVNAFVDEGKGGNPAGVVLNAERFNQEQKQWIAAHVGLSETAFISPSHSADFKLEFFTPSRQIAHCGHATIASFSYLQQIGRIAATSTSKETIDGRREIHLDGDMAFMEQLSPQYAEPSTDSKDVSTEKVLSSIGLQRSDLLDGLEPVVVNTGNAFLILPLKNKDAVRKAEPHHATIEAVSEALDLIGYYLFSPDPDLPGRHAATRMFAPRYGIQEEAATGTAAGPLACFLHDRLRIGSGSDIVIEQGRLMTPPSPSVIRVRLSHANGCIQKLMVGGKATLVDCKTFQLQTDLPPFDA